jgi:hypothetical protein
VVYCPFTIRPAHYGVKALLVEFKVPTFIYGHGSFKTGVQVDLPNDIASFYIKIGKAIKIEEPPPAPPAPTPAPPPVKDTSKPVIVHKIHNETPAKRSKTFIPKLDIARPSQPENNQPEPQENDNKPNIGKVSKPEMKPNLPGENLFRDTGKTASNKRSNENGS